MMFPPVVRHVFPSAPLQHILLPLSSQVCRGAQGFAGRVKGGACGVVGDVDRCGIVDNLIGRTMRN